MIVVPDCFMMIVVPDCFILLIWHFVACLVIICHFQFCCKLTWHLPDMTSIDNVFNISGPGPPLSTQAVPQIFPCILNHHPGKISTVIHCFTVIKFLLLDLKVPPRWGTTCLPIENHCCTGKVMHIVADWDNSWCCATWNSELAVLNS